MNKLITALTISLFVLTATFAYSQSDSTDIDIRYFEKTQLQEDLNYFTGVFRSVHPKPYWYTSAEEFDTTLITFRNELKDSITATAFYSQLLPFVNAIGDENTRVFFPEIVLEKYINADGSFFPFKVQIIDNEIFVEENLLAGNEIPVGAKISAINGKSAKRIIKKLNQLVPGAKESLRMAEIEDNFGLLLWTAYQSDAPFELGVRLPDDGVIHTYNVKGVSAEKLNISVGKTKNARENILDVTIDNDRNFGVVKIADYVSHKELKTFLSSAFAQIKRANVDNIIIDIRDLSVYDAGLPDAVLHNVTNIPYRHYAAIEAKASPITKDFYKGDYKQIMKTQKKVVRDKKAVKQAHKMVLKGVDYANTFYSPEVKKPAGGGTSLKGEFYLLVNEGTKNSGVVLAAIVQDHKQGLVIGTETGSRASRFNDYYYFSLPNTGLQCMVPHRYYLRPSSFDSGFGVLPDYTIEQNADDLAKGIDTAIEFASELFQKRKGYREKQRAYEKRMKKRN